MGRVLVGGPSFFPCVLSGWFFSTPLRDLGRRCRQPARSPPHVYLGIYTKYRELLLHSLSAGQGRPVRLPFPSAPPRHGLLAKNPQSNTDRCSTLQETCHAMRLGDALATTSPRWDHPHSASTPDALPAQLANNRSCAASGLPWPGALPVFALKKARSCPVVTHPLGEGACLLVCFSWSACVACQPCHLQGIALTLCWRA